MLCQAERATMDTDLQNSVFQPRGIWWAVLQRWLEGTVADKDQGVCWVCTPFLWPQVVSWWTSAVLEVIKLWPPLWNEECFVKWFSSVAQLCPTLFDPMDCSTPGIHVHHQPPELTQTHVHWVGDAIQPAHPLSSPSPPALNLSQHQGVFQWDSSSHQEAKVLELQLQHQSFQLTPRTDLL